MQESLAFSKASSKQNPLNKNSVSVPVSKRISACLFWWRYFAINSVFLFSRLFSMYELIFNFSLKRRWHFLVWWLKGRHFRLNFQETDGVKLIFLPCQNLYDNYVFFVVSVIERLNVSVTLFKGSLRNNKLNFVFVVSLVVAIHCVKNMQMRSFSWSLFSSYCTE